MKNDVAVLKSLPLLCHPCSLNHLPSSQREVLALGALFQQQQTRKDDKSSKQKKKQYKEYMECKMYFN